MVLWLVKQSNMHWFTIRQVCKMSTTYTPLTMFSALLRLILAALHCQSSLLLQQLLPLPTAQGVGKGAQMPLWGQWQLA